MKGSPYSNMNIYYNTQSNYGTIKKRDAKEMSKMGISNSSINTRWQTPIKKQEINLFYSQYKTFIESAKNYRVRVLGYRDEGLVDAPKTVMQMQQERARSFTNQHYISPHNAGQKMASGLGFSNSSLPTMSEPSPAQSMQDYIKRAFAK